MSQAAMIGTRLAFVVVPLKGTVKRMKRIMVPKQHGHYPNGDKRRVHHSIDKPVEVEAGFMVYFPRGHALRLTAEQLKRYRLNGNPRLINLQGLNDPNSPAGRLFAAQDDKSRAEAMESLQKQVIRLATVRSGPAILTRDATLQQEAA